MGASDEVAVRQREVKAKAKTAKMVDKQKENRQRENRQRENMCKEQWGESTNVGRGEQKRGRRSTQQGSWERKRMRTLGTVASQTRRTRGSLARGYEPLVCF
jgi:hypothetical protein